MTEEKLPVTSIRRALLPCPTLVLSVTQRRSGKTENKLSANQHYGRECIEAEAGSGTAGPHPSCPPSCKAGLWSQKVWPRCGRARRLPDGCKLTVSCESNTPCL